MSEKLKPCPFCGSDPKFEDYYHPSPNGVVPGHNEFHVVCPSCKTRGPRVIKTEMCDFADYTVQDYRANPALRAKIMDEHDLHVEGQKAKAIELWNQRHTKDRCDE